MIILNTSNFIIRQRHVKNALIFECYFGKTHAYMTFLHSETIKDMHDC